MMCRCLIFISVFLVSCSIGSGFIAASRASQTNTALCAKKITTPSGLQYDDLLVGEGKQPGSSDYVSAHYVAKFAKSGKVFDASRPSEFGLEDTRRLVFQNKPIQIPLGRKAVIAGMDEGVSTMKVGGKRRLFIPADLAYGKNSYKDYQKTRLRAKPISSAA